MTDILWFRHDVFSLSDDKIQVLIAEGGFTAYGFYWSIIEAMYKAEGAIPEMTINALAHAAHLKKNEKEKILSVLVTIGLISLTENKLYFSERVNESIAETKEYQEKRSEHGKMMNSVRWGDNFSNRKKGKEVSCKDATSIHKASYKDTDSIHEASLKGPTVQNRTEEYKERLEQVQVKKQSESSLSHSAQNAQFPPKPDAVKTDFFLTLKDGSKANVDGEWLEGKKALFQGMDVESELRKMSSWLDDNPMKRPLNWKRFAGSWLNRAWDDFRKGIKSNTKNLDYGMAKTSNSDWVGQKGGLIEF